MEESFKSVLSKANSVLVLLPLNPTFDQVASGLALYRTINKEKVANIACPSPMTVEFNRLVDVNRVTAELGSKNLEIKLKGYDGEKMVEKASFDVENGESYLRVFPKPGFAAPTKDQIEIAYSGVSADMVVLVGGGNQTHFPALATGDLATASLVHVGVKEVSLPENQKPLSFARPGSSVCEVVASLIVDRRQGAPAELDPDTATNLVMGIEHATKSFTGDYVTADTFQTVADLLKAGGKRLGESAVLPKRPIGQVGGTRVPDWMTQFKGGNPSIS